VARQPVGKAVHIAVAVLEVDVPLGPLARRERARVPDPVFVQHLHCGTESRDALLAPPRHVRLRARAREWRALRGLRAHARRGDQASELAGCSAPSRVERSGTGACCRAYLASRALAARCREGHCSPLPLPGSATN